MLLRLLLCCFVFVYFFVLVLFLKFVNYFVLQIEMNDGMNRLCFSLLLVKKYNVYSLEELADQ